MDCMSRSPSPVGWPHEHMLTNGIDTEITCISPGLGMCFCRVLLSLPAGQNAGRTSFDWAGVPWRRDRRSRGRTRGLNEVGGWSCLLADLKHSTPTITEKLFFIIIVLIISA